MVYENPGCNDRLHGMPDFAFTFNNFDKTKKLSSKNCYIRTSDGVHMIIDDPMDSWSTFKCLDWYLLKYLAPGWKGHVFLRAAKSPTLARREKDGALYYADDLMVERKYTDKNGIERTDISPHSKLEKNYVRQIFLGISRRCKFSNPERFTGRAARQCGISNVAG